MVQNSKKRQRDARGDLSTPAGRLRWLVDRLQGGKTSVAALAWGVDRPTLSRVLSGKVRKPRGDFLLQIAQASGTTVEWLLTGQGDAPALPTESPPGPVALKALALADHLAFPPESRRMLSEFWGGFAAAARLLIKVRENRDAEPPPDLLYMAHKADDAIARAWARFLTGFVAAYPLEYAQSLFADVGVWQTVTMALNPTVTRFLTELYEDERVPRDVVADIARRTFGAAGATQQANPAPQEGEACSSGRAV